LRSERKRLFLLEIQAKTRHTHLQRVAVRLVSAANHLLRSNSAQLEQAFKAAGLPVERLLRNRVT
jgi:hypothetical protein